MNQTYSTGDLRDLADCSANEARPVAVGEVVGVALPDWSSIQPCAILSPETTRKLGAQLLLAADELDAIQGAAFGLHDDLTEVHHKNGIATDNRLENLELRRTARPTS